MRGVVFFIVALVAGCSVPQNHESAPLGFEAPTESVFALIEYKKHGFNLYQSEYFVESKPMCVGNTEHRDGGYMGLRMSDTKTKRVAKCCLIEPADYRSWELSPCFISKSTEGQ